MPKQDRAIRTRQTILEAAAQVFEEHGYQAATITQILRVAGVTKGALYFHFQSKEELAQGVLAAQDRSLQGPRRPCRMQELVDVIALHTYQLETSPMVRASVRLSMNQHAGELDRSGPFARWGDVVRELLEGARAQGELLPHVDTAQTADVFVGAYAGVQAMSDALSSYQDLGVRVAALLRHVMPSVVVPSVLPSLDFSPDRGARVFEEIGAPSGTTAA
ncbi:ScbR family autoregulator-binding transcription factor [Streptomyces sp. NPDC002004]